MTRFGGPGSTNRALAEHRVETIKFMRQQVWPYGQGAGIQSYSRPKTGTEHGWGEGEQPEQHLGGLSTRVTPG
jgi:hypothetical protein